MPKKNQQLPSVGQPPTDEWFKTAHKRAKEREKEPKDLTMSPEEYRAATGRPARAPLRYPIEEVPTTLKKKRFK